MLKDRGVTESRIFFLTLIAAPEGIHKVCLQFPQVTVITSEIDEKVDEQYRVIPGEKTTFCLWWLIFDPLHLIASLQYSALSVVSAAVNIWPQPLPKTHAVVRIA